MMNINKIIWTDNFWVNKVMPGVIAGLTTGLVLYFILPPAVAAYVRRQQELEREQGL